MHPFSIKNIRNVTLIASLALISGTASAASFPCDRSKVCDNSTLLQHKPSSVELVAKKAERQAYGELYALDRYDSMPSFLQGIHLTQAQQDAIFNVMQQQAPAIVTHVKVLSEAHQQLRDMAVGKQYDQTKATALAERIVDSSAVLALLQAEREYQLYAILTPEQTKLYERLKQATN